METKTVSDLCEEHKIDFKGLAEKSGLEERVCRLLLMLMWARVDGKSPVEYLGAEEKKALVREFASEFLRQAPATLAAVMWAWKERLEADRQGSRTRPGS